MEDEKKLRAIAANLTPERPIRSIQFLKGRTEALDNVVRELRYFYACLFIYGYRGVGKTSLARTAAQMVTPPDREHVYVACSPGSRMLQVFREIGQELLKLALKSGKIDSIKKTLEVELSISPSIRACFEKKSPELEPFHDANGAIRILKELDSLLPNADSTVIVLDELESLNANDRADLAYLVKQLGDQEFRLRFILVGIAENVHELIGAHQSVPRYIKEIPLKPLAPQDLMDIVSNAADEIGVIVPEAILFRIAIIGNGFPHFAHLMGKALLTEAVIADSDSIDDVVYNRGVARAVAESMQELRLAYDAATQRGGDHYKHLIWALADSDVVDVRIDQWIQLYHELTNRLQWPRTEEKSLRYAIGNFKSRSYGAIVSNTPLRYGTTEMRYRYKRFASMLMRGHVRLQAESESVTLGHQTGL